MSSNSWLSRMAHHCSALKIADWREVSFGEPFRELFDFQSSSWAVACSVWSSRALSLRKSSSLWSLPPCRFRMALLLRGPLWLLCRLQAALRGLNFSVKFVWPCLDSRMTAIWAFSLPGALLFCIFQTDLAHPIKRPASCTFCGIPRSRVSSPKRKHPFRDRSAHWPQVSISLGVRSMNQSSLQARSLQWSVAHSPCQWAWEASRRDAGKGQREQSFPRRLPRSSW